MARGRGPEGRSLEVASPCDQGHPEDKAADQDKSGQARESRGLEAVLQLAAATIPKLNRSPIEPRLRQSPVALFRSILVRQDKAVKRGVERVKRRAPDRIQRLRPQGVGGPVQPPQRVNLRQDGHGAGSEKSKTNGQARRAGGLSDHGFQRGIPEPAGGTG